MGDGFTGGQEAQFHLVTDVDRIMTKNDRLSNSSSYYTVKGIDCDSIGLFCDVEVSVACSRYWCFGSHGFTDRHQDFPDFVS